MRSNLGKTPEEQERKRLYQRAWRTKNPDKIKARRIRQQEYMRAYQINYRKKITDEQRARYKIHNLQGRNERKRVNVLYLRKLKSVPCADCGKTYPPECMDFHHVTGHKEYDISTLALSRLTVIARIDTEAQKCVILCANCHRIRTYAEGSYHDRVTKYNK